MTDSANTGDNSLWNRLHALKQKSQETKAAIPELQSRLQALKGNSSPDAKDTTEIAIAQKQSAVDDAANTYLEQEVDEEPDIDQLLKDIGSDGDFGPVTDHRTLLQEAHKAIQQADEDLPDPAAEKDEKAENEEEEEVETENKSDAGDSDAAAEYLEKVLAEISIDSKDPGEPVVGEQEEEHDEEETSKLFEDLPSPSSKELGVVTGTTKTGDFEERLAALLKDKKQAGKLAETEADIDPTEDWCIICYDDATVQCLGCDGDLYCTKCWKEGHTGPDVGLEERRHKALAYNKSTKKKKQLLAS